MGVGRKELIAKRAAKEVCSFSVINLGIGIPTLIADYLPIEKNVMIHGENGILGIGAAPKIGEEDANIINAGGIPCSIVEGGSYFDSALSFGMIRKGLIDITFLGTLEVDEKGDLANWIVPGKKVPGMGGGMELAQYAKKVIVVTRQLDRNGNSKIRKKCTLPITASGCVDLIITDMAVFKIVDKGLLLTEIFSDTTVEEVRNCTEANIEVAEDLKIIEVN